VPDPALLVLFGATGDLAQRKVVPALFQLWRTNLLPHEFGLVAVGRRPYDDEAFRAELRASLEQFSRVLPIEAPAWEAFAERITYHRGDFGDQALYDGLVTRLDGLDAVRGTRGNRVYYLATQPSAFASIIAGIGRVGLDHEHHGEGWRRIVVEKPFGRDLTSAIRLNREVGKVFRESQVYRIDHYLGKETVRNILVFRFGNGIFEPIWHRRYVDHVQITVAESIGVEKRGSFYEEAGASRDFLQNHLMQLLALVAMEPPTTFDADALRDEKVKVLRAIEPMGPGEVATSVVRGQYGPGWVAGEAVAGYRGEPEVDPASETETFVAARLFVDDWRWAGVPFYLRAGKRLPKRATEIAIQFKQVPHALFKESNADPEANLLALRIQPDEGIARMPTRRSSSTRCSATRPSSPAPTRSRRRGGSSRRSSRPGPTSRLQPSRTMPPGAGGPTRRTRSRQGTGIGGGGSEPGGRHGKRHRRRRRRGGRRAVRGPCDAR